jgi:hypothetical protein
VQIALPVHSAPKPPDFRLLPQPEQSPQTFFHCLAFSFDASDPKRVAHQLVINNDIGPHDVYAPFKIVHIAISAQPGTAGTVIRKSGSVWMNVTTR